MKRPVPLKFIGPVFGRQPPCVYFHNCEANNMYFQSKCLNKNKTFLWQKAVWSINHSQGAEILCKVFGEDSWLVGAADHELGFVRDVKLWHCCPALCFCEGGVMGRESVTCERFRWENHCLQLALCVSQQLFIYICVIPFLNVWFVFVKTNRLPHCTSHTVWALIHLCTTFPFHIINLVFPTA